MTMLGGSGIRINHVAVAYALALCSTIMALMLYTRNSSLEIECPAPSYESRPQTQKAAQPEGWKYPAFFVGNKTYDKINERWTSQAGQDRTIIDIFHGKRGGYYVDLAAHDAWWLSNTLTLEQEYGWEGLCVEPNTEFLAGLLHRRCQVAVAVAGRETNADVQFNFNPSWCGTACGGVINNEFDNKPGGSARVEGQQAVDMKTVTVEKLLDDMGVPREIDYLSLDIEGAEMWAFEHFAWHKYIFKVITVERPKKLVEVLAANGYTYVKDHGDFGDQMWIHKSLPNFDEVMAKYHKPQE